jgi:hypothetical protein
MSLANRCCQNFADLAVATQPNSRCTRVALPRPPSPNRGVQVLAYDFKLVAECSGTLDRASAAYKYYSDPAFSLVRQTILKSINLSKMSAGGYYNQGNQGGYPPYGGQQQPQQQGYPPQQGQSPYPTDPNQGAYGQQPQYGSQSPQPQYGATTPQYGQQQQGYPQSTSPYQQPYEGQRGASPHQQGQQQGYPPQGQYPGQPGAPGEPGERGVVGGAFAGSLLGGIGSKLTGHDGGKGALLGAIVGGIAGHHKKKKEKKYGQRGVDSSDEE